MLDNFGLAKFDQTTVIVVPIEYEGRRIGVCFPGSDPGLDPIDISFCSGTMTESCELLHYDKKEGLAAYILGRTPCVKLSTANLEHNARGLLYTLPPSSGKIVRSFVYINQLENPSNIIAITEPADPSLTGVLVWDEVGVIGICTPISSDSDSTIRPCLQFRSFLDSLK